jgi:hypothetical protein
MGPSAFARGLSALAITLRFPHTVVMELPGDDDLDYVRRQLNDLSIVRAMCVATEHDNIRYADLCAKELVLLAAAPRAMALA